MRPASSDDALAIAAVQIHAWQAAYRGLIADEELDGLSLAERGQRWRAILEEAQAPSLTLVVEDDKVIVGFCALIAPARDEDLGARSGEVAALYIEPDRWRSGLGSALLLAALAVLSEGDCDEAAVWLVAGNQRAEKFYHRHGFRGDGARRPASASAVAELRMRRSLVEGR